MTRFRATPMKTTRFSLLGLLLAFGLLAMPDRSEAAEFCADNYYVEQSFSNGARWDMCWEHRVREGVVLHHVFYTPPGGVRQSVLNEAAIAQIHVPYDDNSARYHDVSDYGLGISDNEIMQYLTSEDCTNGTLLSYSGQNIICRQVFSEGEGYRVGTESGDAGYLSLFSVSAVGAYNYVPQWRFYNNGTIEPWMGATGALQRFTTTDHTEKGWLIEPDRVGLSHLHNFFWKLDFDLGDSAYDDVVEEFNFQLSSGRRIRSTSTFGAEIARSVSPSTLRSWRIRDSATNANGHPQGWEIILNESGHKDIGPDSEPFTQNDFYVTKYKSCELYGSHNYSLNCGNNLAGYVNGEFITGTDIVTWVGQTFYHVPRVEDQPMMDAHWNHFRIVPRDIHSTNPYGEAAANTAPLVVNPGSQTSTQNSSVQLTVSASDAEGNALTFSATSLPNGLSINSDTGIISGTPTSAGSYTPVVTVSDGQDSSQVSFAWTVNSTSGSWTTAGTLSSNISATPADGWSFLWNPSGPVGSSTSYTPLLWNGTSYDSDGAAGSPDNTELAYGYLASGRGHAGRGTSQGAAQDRYVVTRYTTPTEANYRITTSNVAHTGCAYTNGLLLKIYVDDVARKQISIANGSSAGFDMSLGTLAAGANIDVGVGPSGADGCDQFSIDYTIQSAPATSSPNTAPSVTTPSEQTTALNVATTLQIQASDAEGDVLTYSATGLPEGVAINSLTGKISGSATESGTFNVIVSVSDSVASRSVNFSWIVTENGAQWSQAGHFSTATVASPATGWSFHWNANGAIGNSAAYSNMLWNGGAYDSDGSVTSPDNTELAYGHLKSGGGHPGRGTAQGVAQDRYVIARYTTQQDGNFRISSGNIAQSSCAWGNGLKGLIYVNNVLKSTLAVDASGTALAFSSNIGNIASGSTIEVAVGPNTADGCDGFLLDFLIERTSVNGIVNQRPVLTAVSNQTSNAATALTLNIRAQDTDGDTLSFTATGLPSGLSINSATGEITGTPSTAGIYKTYISVSDGKAKSWTGFTWVVSASTSSWTSVGNYAAALIQTPPPGWSFLWNQNNAIGSAAGYTPLIWNGSAYDSDGSTLTEADSSDLNYGKLTPAGGHPGKGISNGATADRYVISRYTTTGATTSYRITTSSIAHSSCEWSNGLDARIFVNNVQKYQIAVPADGTAKSLDLSLGQLTSGTTVDVAIGPGASDGCDGFVMDYTVQKLQ